MTPLDQSHEAMEASPEDETLRLAFYRTLAETELFLLLEREAEGEKVEPQIFPVGDTSYVLAFDREDRLSGFTGRLSPFAALSGRTLAGVLAAEGLGLGLNLEVAPSAMLVPPDAVQWLAEMVGQSAEDLTALPKEVTAPKGLPPSLITALDGKLAQAAGLARSAFLVGVTYEDGRRSHLLAVIDAASGAEGAITQSVREALLFSGIEAGVLDVGFFSGSAAITSRFAKVGLRFDLPEIAMPSAPEAPGSDPSRPPKLR